MPEELTKQAGSIGETLQKVWKDNEAYHPGVYGALGGAAFAGLGTMGRRANENPRQRALRIIRNAAAGGLLGGMGTQLVTQGIEQAGDSMINPNKTEGHKPGFLSSIPARLGYMGGTALAGNKIFRRRNLLNSLESMLPATGLGKIEYDKHDAGTANFTRVGAATPPPAGATTNTANFPKMEGEDSFLDSAKRRSVAKLTDLEFRNAAKNDPRGFENLVRAIQDKTMQSNGVVDKNLGDFLKANYYRGEGGHPINARGMMRGLNFFGTAAPNGLMRGLGGLGSAVALTAAGTAPDWMNHVMEATGEQVDKLPGKVVDNPFAPSTAPAAPPQESWISQLTKGKRFF